MRARRCDDFSSLQAPAQAAGIPAFGTIRLIVSVHIPKTGGATFRRSILEPAFGSRLLVDHDDAPLSHNTVNRIARAQSFELSPELPERYDCVHGHFLPIKYMSERIACEFAIWFRDPVQRIVSRFLHGKRMEGGIVTPEMTIWEFCEIKRFQNTYAKYLWGFDFERFDFVGITENYENSVEVFWRRFGVSRVSGGNDADAAIVNANPDKAPAQSYEIDERLRGFIRRRNREDFEVYDAACCSNRRLQHEFLRA